MTLFTRSMLDPIFRFVFIFFNIQMFHVSEAGATLARSIGEAPNCSKRWG